MNVRNFILTLGLILVFLLHLHAGLLPHITSSFKNSFIVKHGVVSPTFLSDCLHGELKRLHAALLLLTRKQTNWSRMKLLIYSFTEHLFLSAYYTFSFLLGDGDIRLPALVVRWWFSASFTVMNFSSFPCVTITIHTTWTVKNKSSSPLIENFQTIQKNRGTVKATWTLPLLPGINHH